MSIHDSGETLRTAIAIRHLAFEDLGLIELWLKCQGWRVSYFDAGVDDLGSIDLTNVDLLVVLGGPIGAYEDELYPFLPGEVRLIKRRIDSRKAILGICLGAQLMARALGASVGPMKVKEIGFGPLTLTNEGATSPLGRIGKQPVLHWHGDQFELPPGVASLAETAVCKNQAFTAGEHAMAWQFHLEVDTLRIEQWLVGHTHELRHDGIDIAALRAEALSQRSGLSRTLDSVMTDWFKRVGLL